MLKCLQPIVAAVLTLLMLTVSAFAEKRVALVIGNSAYVEVGKLLNPENDAAAIADSFKRLGFSRVLLRLNLDYRGFRSSLSEFSRFADGADMAIIYFAGHGIEVAKRNYLIPIDAKLNSPRDAEFEALPLDVVMSALEGAKKLRVVVLDACRNNPFRAKMVSRGGTRSVGRGLARVDAPSNTLVAYAAREGTTAEDGDGRNSPYTKALLQHLETPGLELNFLFRRVRDSVLKATGGRQQPFVYGSLSSDAIYLKPGPNRSAQNLTPASPPASVVSEATQAWALIKDTRDKAVLEAYVARFKDSFYATLARARLKALAGPKVASLPPAKPAGPMPSFDGQWKVTVSSLSGCANNKVRFFLMNVRRGKISEPHHPFPKKGSVSKNGQFAIFYTSKVGNRVATLKGTIKSASGQGKFQGFRPRCTGVLTLKRL